MEDDTTVRHTKGGDSENPNATTATIKNKSSSSSDLKSLLPTAKMRFMKLDYFGRRVQRMEDDGTVKHTKSRFMDYDYDSSDAAAAGEEFRGVKGGDKIIFTSGSDVQQPSTDFDKYNFQGLAAAGGTVAVASKPPPKQTKGDNCNINNNSFSNRNDDDTNQDDDSSTTIPLPGFESDVINHNNNNNKQEEIDLSVDCSDDDDDPAFVNNDNRNDNDDSSRDNGDKKPKHKKKDAVVMIPTTATATVNKSLRDSLIDIYSDDSLSSSSNDWIDLFTPRLTEKKEQQKKTSFTIDTSMSATKLNDANNDKNKSMNCPDSTRSTSSKLLTPREFSPSSTSC